MGRKNNRRAVACAYTEKQAIRKALRLIHNGLGTDASTMHVQNFDAGCNLYGIHYHGWITTGSPESSHELFNIPVLNFSSQEKKTRILQELFDH